MFLRPQEILSLRGAADLDKLEQVRSSNPQPSIASAIADLQQRANFMLHPFSLLMDMFGCGVMLHCIAAIMARFTSQ